MAAATYLTLGALLAQVQGRRRQKMFLLGLGAALALLVGMSRIYLGVHWPTDVLAGWTVGAGWAAMIWLVARVLQRHGLLRHASGETEIPPPSESSSSSNVT
jgi:undecaprenyl-diphosphatase